MTVLAVVSQKGGVGKTTIALNLALALAQRGWRTALVDVDPQGGVGLSLTGRTRAGAGLVGWLGGLPLGECLIDTRQSSLSLLPVGSPPWGQLARWSADLAEGGALPRLARELESRFDVVLFDTPAGLHGPTFGALRAASHVLLPLQAEPLALRSVTQVLEVISALREQGASVQLAAVLLSMVRFRDELSSSVAHEAWALFPEELMLESYVPRDSIFVEASAKGVPLGLLGRRPPPVAAVFDHIARELEARLGLQEDSSDGEIIPLVD